MSHARGIGSWISGEGLFFFSSRRRHTRFDCDWSSDVCSSDLAEAVRVVDAVEHLAEERDGLLRRERAARSEERRVGKGVDLGGRCIIKKKKGKDDVGMVR